ncbi:MAG: carboxypeptidase regulatory-like domain-containing protein [Chloroflexota bacterium]|nr:MAG: carboxypeptidase regulatory-like domain-containing protein [Chloroflexota bacterium]
MGKALIINYDICNGCYNCQIACKDEHVGNDWTPYAKPQPATGQFWMKITDMVRGTVPKVRVTYLHDICQHCDEAPCIPVCTAHAIYRRDDGIVIINPERCCGHRNCISACPYGVIYFNWDLNIAQKCTMCAHLLDAGWKEPRCVDACPTGALKFGEEEDLKGEISKSELLHPEFEAKPRVYYIGLPKSFVAGAVYCPEEDKCLQDATASLVDSDTGEKFTAKTDNYGDFWFENMKVDHTYSLRIEKDGYYPQEIHDISTVKDVNVGDIALHGKIKARKT